MKIILGFVNVCSVYRITADIKGKELKQTKKNYCLYTNKKRLFGFVKRKLEQM